MRTCNVCGVDISHRHLLAKRCGSKECLYEVNNRTRRALRGTERKCILCNIDISSYNRSARRCKECFKTGRIIRPNVRKTRLCLGCSLDISRKPNNVKRCTPCQKIWRAKCHAIGRSKKPEKVNEIRRRWKKNHPEQAVADFQRRRARFASVESDEITKETWAEILETFGHRCAYCLEEKKLEMDHVVPISKGGTHTYDNLVPACGKCNASKGDRSLLDFLARGIISDRIREVALG